MFTNAANSPRITTVHAVHGTRVTSTVLISFYSRVSIIRHAS